MTEFDYLKDVLTTKYDPLIKDIDELKSSIKDIYNDIEKLEVKCTEDIKDLHDELRRMLYQSLAVAFSIIGYIITEIVTKMMH